MLTPFNSLNRPAPGTEISIPLRDNPPGWLVEAIEFQTFPDAVYPWDETIVKKCQKIDPLLRPMWVKLVFKRPVDDARGWEWKVFGRHALGRALQNPSSDRPKLPLLRGLSDKSPPNIVIEILEDNRPWMKEEGQGDLPGKYLKFGEYIYKGVMQKFINYNIKADEPDKQNLIDKREATKINLEKMWAEFRRDKEDFQRTFVQPRLSRESEVTAAEWLKNNARGLTGPSPRAFAFLSN